MTPLQKYRSILADIERLLDTRSRRYFSERHAGIESELLKVQCDTLMAVLKTHLEPEVTWFECYEEDNPPAQRETQALLTIDLEPERGDMFDDTD